MHTTRHVLKSLLAAAIGLGLLCITAGSALAASAYPTLPAHAKVISSTPAIGSTISQAPTKVTVTTAEEVNPDPAKSNLFVYGPGADATATLISQGNAQIPLSNPKEMSINITPDKTHPNGVYIVIWKTVSADDGDPAQGAFSFTVNSNGITSTPTATTPQTNTPPASAGNTSAPGMPIWVPLVAALAALLVGLGIGLGLGRRKPAAASTLGAMRTSVVQDLEQEETSKRP